MSVESLLTASMPLKAYGVDPLSVADIDGMAGGHRVWRTIHALQDYFDTTEEERVEALIEERKKLHIDVGNLVAGVREALTAFHQTGSTKDLVLVDKVLQQLEQRLED